MIFASCEYFEEDVSMGSYTFIDLLDELKTTPDNEGNLEIDNTTNFRYVLYVNDSLNRIIPAHENNFKIFIPTNGGKTFNLKLYKKTDLSNSEILNPPSIKIVYQWDVVLPKETWDNVRVAWLIDENIQSETAEVKFLYGAYDGLGNSNVYSVDVYLNNRSGQKILSLSPGGQTINELPYGYQVLYFRYWISNPNSPTGQDEIGWVEIKPNGLAYSLVLNSFNNAVEFQVPVYFEVYPQETGFIKLVNQTEIPFYIKANGNKFEDFIIFPEGISTTDLSYIDGNYSSEYYKIPIGEYLMKAINPVNGYEHASEVIILPVNDSIIWTIN
jgi:hypothetical protein